VNARIVLFGLAIVAACSAPARETASAPTNAPERTSGDEAAASTSSVSSASDSATFVAPHHAHSPDYDRLLVQLDALDAVMLGTPDCGRACAHLATLCELAERVCALALEQPDRDVEAECTVGRERCQANTRRVANVCSCPKP
jgi:hypothetical protein